MLTYGSEKDDGVISISIVGVFICLGVILFLIAATIVLSLISIYTPNHGEEGYGEQYQIKTLLIKALYQDISYTFLNGTVADSIEMSNLCSSMYRNQGATNFAGCVATNFRAFGPYNNSQNSRRRRVTYVGMYEIGEIDLYYSTSCPKKGDRLKYSNSTSLTNCVKNRLTACNNLVNGSSNFTEWNPLPIQFLQSIVDQNGSDYRTIDVTNLFVIPFSIASSLAGSLPLSNETIAYIPFGCQYIGPLPQANITDALLAQSTATTTLPASTNSLFG